ncbi:uncharacterized protein LOC131691419 [Topomyia yanbarensis]|uniref:uncharacterized protein LOC131691419 n=1 Tax=Topomyia yanbarensis TaxID=2498891 RepID=UPI00273A8A66|nr:uncharacterized protein LOC131691419 [Topomyia yanbarensis]
MDGLEQRLKKQVELINRIETFFELQACKSEIASACNILYKQSRDSSNALREAQKSMEYFRNQLCHKFAKVKQVMHRNELLMLHLMEQIDKTPNEKALKEQNPNTLLVSKESKKSSHPNLQTIDKMFLTDYQKSPFVSKMKPRCLSFLDFNICITPEEFEQIPKYMKGRESLDELVGFLQSVVVSCFEEKYSLLYKNKKAVVNQQDLALWKVFHQQQSAFPNSKFITQGDIARKLGRLIDKKVNAKLTMLRHLHILQETRSEGTVYYIWSRE